MQRLIPLLISVFILTGAMSSCKDDPILPPSGKCDTCAVDTTDTTDTVVVTPNDTTSHDFIWEESSIPGEASITGCWVFDDTTIWVVSNDLYKWSSTGWQKLMHFNSGTSIFAFTPKDAWFVYYELIWRLRDGNLEQIRLENAPYHLWDASTDGAFRAAWGTSSNDMFFVGDKGTIVHFDGTNWMKFPKVTQKNLRSVWGTSSNDVWAAGFNSSTDESVLLHYDGVSWKEDESSVTGQTRRFGIGSVWSCDSAGHRFTALAGATVLRQTDNGPWRSDSGKLPNALSGGGFVETAIKGNGPNDLLTAGGWGFIAHWNGSTWHRYDHLFNPSAGNYGASTMHIRGNTAVVAGRKNGSWVAIGRRTK